MSARWGRTARSIGAARTAAISRPADASAIVEQLRVSTPENPDELADAVATRFGAPDLTDDVWLYGDSNAAVAHDSASPSAIAVKYDSPLHHLPAASSSIAAGTPPVSSSSSQSLCA